MSDRLEAGDGRSRVPLVLKPVISAEKIGGIKSMWAMEDERRQARREFLRGEELRLADLGFTSRGRLMADIYADATASPSSRLAGKYVETQDDVLILFRRALDPVVSAVVGNDARVGEIIKVGPSELFNRKIGSVFKPFFPSYREVLTAAFPELDLQPFQFKNLPASYWQGEDGKRRTQEAIKWRFEVDLQQPRVEPLEYREWLRGLGFQQVLSKYNIYGGVTYGYKRASEAVVDTYPELNLRPWEFKTIYQGEEGNNIMRQATRWLVEERLGLSVDDPQFDKALKDVRAQHFMEAGIGSYVTGSKEKRKYKLGGGSHLKLLDEVYADLSPKVFSEFSKNSWRGEEGVQRSIDRTRELVEVVLGIDPSDPDFRAKVTAVKKESFLDNDLGGMLSTLHGKTASRAIVAAYPELDIKEWETHVPSGFWQTDNHANVGRALRWLIEERLGLDPNDPNLKDKLLKFTLPELDRNRVGTIFKATKLTIVQAWAIAYPQIQITEDEFMAANKMRNGRNEKKRETSVSKIEANAALDSLFEGELL